MEKTRMYEDVLNTKEAILYLDHGEITGLYSEELDEAVQKLKSSEE